MGRFRQRDIKIKYRLERADILTHRKNPLVRMKNRDECEKPVFRAFVALQGEIPVEVTARCLPGCGLYVWQTQNKNSLDNRDS